MLQLVTAAAVVSAAAAQAPAPANASVSWPPGPRLECTWDAGAQQLAVSWAPTFSPFPQPLPADVYEVQISDSASARASAVHTTSGTNITLGLDLLLPGRTYYLAARGHAGWVQYESGPSSWPNCKASLFCFQIAPPFSRSVTGQSGEVTLSLR